MFSKKPRIEDRALLDHVAAKPCWVLGCIERPSDPHHVTTVKAGGGDTATNVMPLCRRHHTEYHQIGPGRMCAKYPSVLVWLVRAGRHDILTRAGIELW